MGVSEGFLMGPCYSSVLDSGSACSEELLAIYWVHIWVLQLVAHMPALEE